ncbi:ABC transporter permease family protein [Cohnella rhizosphaerae]|uniref:Sugar ABC transporter permease n=1 Tax=Cohnella rhizosphaerae TaxID=1457232 RepID=A0A9X4KPE5_9BACL|nr:hypothetical protein [Cohnella rhizosphaerae]MDG0808295.1 hypothetical protein [Cohnella rhizosphaerae]
MLKTASRRENTISPLTNFALNGGFIVLALACVLPVVLVIVVSFTHNDSLLSRGYSFFPAKWSLIAYESLFKDYGTILRAYGVSVGITAAGTLLSVLLMALYAYPISRQDYPLRPFFTFFFVFHDAVQRRHREQVHRVHAGTRAAGQLSVAYASAAHRPV